MSENHLRWRKDIPGIDKTPRVAHFKVEVRAGGIAGVAPDPDRLTFADMLAAARNDRSQVGIQGLVAVAMIDHDHIAIAPICPTGKYDHAAVCGKDRQAISGSQIQAQVACPIIIADQGMDRCGPNK